MLVIIDTDVASKLGYPEAIFLGYMDDYNPSNNKFRLNISYVCRLTSIPLSTGQKAVKTLVEKKYLIRHSSGIYSFTDSFYTDFPAHYFKKHTYGKYHPV